jgi:hypothetical protein
LLKFSVLASVPFILVLAGCDGGGGGDKAEAPSAEALAAARGVDPDVPAIKAGKWRVSVASMAGPEFPAQTVCLSAADAAAKAGLGERATLLPCAPRDVRKEGDSVVTEAVCNVGGVMRSIKTTAYGDFSSDYFVDYIENNDPPPAENPPEIHRKMHARYMGDC